MRERQMVKKVLEVNEIVDIRNENVNEKIKIKLLENDKVEVDDDEEEMLLRKTTMYNTTFKK